MALPPSDVLIFNRIISLGISAIDLDVLIALEPLTGGFAGWFVCSLGKKFRPAAKLFLNQLIDGFSL